MNKFLTGDQSSPRRHFLSRKRRKVDQTEGANQTTKPSMRSLSPRVHWVQKQNPNLHLGAQTLKGHGDLVTAARQEITDILIVRYLCARRLGSACLSSAIVIGALTVSARNMV
jgi:hypothetical protein